MQPFRALTESSVAVAAAAAAAAAVVAVVVVVVVAVAEFVGAAIAPLQCSWEQLDSC